MNSTNPQAANRIALPETKLPLVHWSEGTPFKVEIVAVRAYANSFDRGQVEIGLCFLSRGPAGGVIRSWRKRLKSQVGCRQVPALG